MFCSFFFQAEDGIRDLTVTGVQTCALPIYRGARGDRDNARPAHAPPPRPRRRAGGGDGPIPGRRGADPPRRARARSEERRVGKECRSRGAPDLEKIETEQGQGEVWEEWSRG